MTEDRIELSAAAVANANFMLTAVLVKHLVTEGKLDAHDVSEIFQKTRAAYANPLLMLFPPPLPRWKEQIEFVLQSAQAEIQRSE
jgi:hypothetical protein